jgi:hypothetical protein
MTSTSSILHFQPISAAGLAELTRDGRILEQDHRGPKVFQLHDGKILKLFLVKRLLSSATLQPYSLRFMRNAVGLQRLDIPTLKVQAAYRLPEWRRTAVLYEPLPGATLRQMMEKGALSTVHAAQLGVFVANLHSRGIYFRSLHFGNIVQTSSGDFGLIDIADLKLRRGPLSSRHRLRNLRHLCRLPQDRQWFKTIGWRHFCDAYLQHNGAQGQWNNRALHKLHQLVDSK